ncbi:MAG: xanthine dehydrogenase family protein molybdopterin-binding subunit [Rhodothermales bacterium]|nr:xanthine dehydrogenase family protein molybdopterin-binding subunit [Rhodothermales bacterium]MBO6779417.1 xanthine dehydrogenase family protein molybdopterin-binding subunit [Rhodothermales bacterium]
MATVKTTLNRRSFLKASALAGGGLVIGFNWMAGCRPQEPEMVMPDEWFDINGYVSIGNNGVVTITAPNPEFGQNVKTSMPMIVAEELDVDWRHVLVEQARFDAAVFPRQFTGGSQGIRRAWSGLRMAGGAARHMLRQAAADAWQVPFDEVTAEAGVLRHAASGNEAGYGEMAQAASAVPVPAEVELKDASDFRIIGTSRKNVDAKDIVTGKPLFAIDRQEEGMLVAMIVHPPAFGMQLRSVDGTSVRSMPGIRDVFSFKTYNDDYQPNFFDTNAFPELVAVVGETTWQVLKAKRALQAEWQPIPAGGTVPQGLENSEDHKRRMEEMAARPGQIARRDGNPEAAFTRAARVIERSYTAPYLAHNPMEPINCVAHVTEDHADLAGPVQAPEIIERTLSARLGLPVEAIEIHPTRMGGGFGRRAYSHYMVEAAVISQQVGAPVKLIYTREDDMTYGIYRPTYHATYRAALDADDNLIAFHVKAGGIPETPLFANRFPAGAVENYLAESWAIPSNITIGAFRAPRSNFIAGAEQSFLDELAEAMGKDPIALRMEMLDRAQNDPVGQGNDYDAARLAGVLDLVREKSGWGETASADVHRGVAAYFCHNSYAAHVLDLSMRDGTPVVERVCCAVDCGIVVNPDAAVNMAEGAIVDGIGNAMYGQLTFEQGVPQKRNFDTYRMIRHGEAPKSIDVHFVDNGIDPTGLGEPPFPPIFGALANALYQATGRRLADQPFAPQLELMVQEATG